LTVVAAILPVRIHTLQTPPRIELGARARELARVHDLAVRVSQYATQYGRPVLSQYSAACLNNEELFRAVITQCAALTATKEPLMANGASL
jgi:hypothetical protein